MDILIFLYNIILLVLFGVVFTLAFVCYKKMKHPIYLAVGLLFIIYICDNTIIYMTEFISWFSVKYDAWFMTIPAFKTISLLSQAACLLYICNTLLKQKIPFRQYIVLLSQTFVLMFVPMMADSAYKVWLYYLPCQMYLFWLSCYGLLTIKKTPERFTPEEYRTVKKIFHYGIVFAILILIEDTIVIFNFDTYSRLIVRINNRNICEDIMTIIFSMIALGVFSNLLSIVPKPFEVSEHPDEAQKIQIAAEQKALAKLKESETTKMLAAGEAISTAAIPVSALIATANIEIEIIEHFSEYYELTGREREIFTYLIRDKSNQEICDELCISIGTVKAHIHNIFVKTNALKRSQVVRAYKDFTKEYLKENA